MEFIKVIKIYANLDNVQPCLKGINGKNSLEYDIRSLQNDVRRLKNYSMRMCFDYDQSQYDYFKYMERCKEELGVSNYPQAYPLDFSKYKSFDGFIYNAVAKDYPAMNKNIVGSITKKYGKSIKKTRSRSYLVKGHSDPIKRTSQFQIKLSTVSWNMWMTSIMYCTYRCFHAKS